VKTHWETEQGWVRHRDPAGSAGAGSSSHPTRTPGRNGHRLLHLSIRAALGEQQGVWGPRAGADPLASCWGTVGPAAFSLHHRSQPSPPPFCSSPPALSCVGPKAKGRWERAGRGWSWGEQREAAVVVAGLQAQMER